VWSDQIPEDDDEDDRESMLQFVLRRMNEDADENEGLHRLSEAECPHQQFPMMTGSLISLNRNGASNRDLLLLLNPTSDSCYFSIVIDSFLFFCLSILI
jgi:hypothetical protein